MVELGGSAKSLQMAPPGRLEGTGTRFRKPQQGCTRPVNAPPSNSLTETLTRFAERTDSAVVIGDREGWVQWVNDAFERISQTL